MRRPHGTNELMEIVVTHNNMDFDALAAQFAVTLLYPSVKIVLGQPLVGNVREFIALYRSSLPIVQSKYIDLEKVTRIFVVDCQNMERLDEHLQKFLAETKNRPPITVFDHHEKDPDGLFKIATEDSVFMRVGSAATLLVDKLRKEKRKLTHFEATLLALGIYEDTGCLTYSGTTETDAQCVAYLIKHGVDLEQVNANIRAKLNEQQVRLLETLVKNAHVEMFEGAKVVLSSARTDTYVDGLANLTRKMIEIMSCDAAFTAVHMKDRIHLVGRSDSRSIDVKHVVRKFGGDGHPGAASAVIKQDKVEPVLEEVKTIIAEKVPREVCAVDIMGSPVRTIRPSSTMEEANRLMIRYGQDGLIVVEDEEVVGVVSRRDIDQAMHHKLGHAPVQGFMSRPVISIKPDTGLHEIQHIMVHEDIGRLPVLDDGHLIGLVTRHNVLQTLYGTYATGGDTASGEGEELPTWPRTKRRIKHDFFRDKLEELEAPVRWLYQEIGEVAARQNMVAYSVGGCVRDLFLGRPNFDLDFVIEGSAVELAEALERECPSRFEVVAKHDRFQTATLIFHGEKNREVDLSTARTEYYEFPAALPTVEPSKLEQDLYRRDFTINAMAICLNPSRYGELIDHFDGLEDLRKKVVRILHPFSFIEDPTRIVRAARFAARLGFHLDSKTRERARKAVAMGIFDELGGKRLREELKMILESPHRISALDLLDELGGCLRFLDRDLDYNLRAKSLVRRAERLLERYAVEEPWIVFLGLLVSYVPIDRLYAVLDRLQLANDQKTKIEKGVTLAAETKVESDLSPRSKIFRMWHGQPRESLAIAACLAAPGTNVRRDIKLYLEELAEVSVKLTGRDLVEMGMSQGPEVGKMLSHLLDGKLDGTIKSEADERKFVLKNIERV